MKLNITTHVYFNQNDFEQIDILKEFYDDANSHSVDNIEYTDFLSNDHLEDFLKFLGPNLLTLLKMIMLEKKIIIFSEQSSKVSQFMIAILALMPAIILFKFNDAKHIKTYNKAINRYGFPLKIFNQKTLLLLSASIRDLKKLEKVDGYFVGTTN